MEAVRDQITSTLEQSSLHDYLGQVVSMFDTPVTFFKLIGYSFANRAKDPHKKYTNAKQPFEKGWQLPEYQSHTIVEFENWVKAGGWIGLRIPTDYILVDVDDNYEGEIIKGLLDSRSIKHHAIKTPNGFQFFFKDNGVIRTQNTKAFTQYGFLVDYRLQNKGYIVLPLAETKGRYWLTHHGSKLDPMPEWFNLIKTVKNEVDRPFTIPIGEGSRNDTLFKHGSRLKGFGKNDQEIQRTLHFINRFLCDPPLDYDEVETIVGSCMKYAGPTVVKRQSDSTPPVDIDIITSGKEIPKFTPDDIGNAERLAYFFGNRIRYSHSQNCWFIWNGKHWEQDGAGRIVEYAKATARNIYKEILNETEGHKRDKIAKHALASQKAKAIRDMIKLAQSIKGIPVRIEDLDADHWLMNCKNGVIDLKTGQLLPHDPKYLMTKMIPTEYDPKAQCPTWIAFLQRILRDREGNILHDVICYLQKAIGYSLTGETSEQVIFFLHGSGSNGKSTFINVIKHLLGDYAKQTNTETFMLKTQETIRNDLARLKGARLVSAVEAEEGRRLSESFVKQVTGGDPVIARFLHKEYFEFIPTFKIFFVTNHKPKIYGTDYAIWRRIRLIPFNVTIPQEERDPSLYSKLIKELPGILRWAVEGCLLWQREGLDPPREVQAATEDYQDEMDSLSDFIEDCLIIDPDKQVTTKSLYTTYQGWCFENKEYEMSKNKFIEKLLLHLEVRGHNIRRVRIGTKQDRGYAGITLSTLKYLPNTLK